MMTHMYNNSNFNTNNNVNYYFNNSNRSGGIGSSNKHKRKHDGYEKDDLIDPQSHKKYRTVSEKIGVLSLRDDPHPHEDGSIDLTSADVDDSVMMEQTSPPIVSSSSSMSNKNQQLAIVPIVDVYGDSRHVNRADMSKKKAGGYQLATESHAGMDIRNLLYTPPTTLPTTLPCPPSGGNELSLILYTQPTDIINESLKRHVREVEEASSERRRRSTLDNILTRFVRQQKNEKKQQEQRDSDRTTMDKRTIVDDQEEAMDIS